MTEFKKTYCTFSTSSEDDFKAFNNSATYRMYDEATKYTYLNVEHYMAITKADFFKDKAASSALKKSSSIGDVRKHEKEINDSDEFRMNMWENKYLDVLKYALILKFKTYAQLSQSLIDTGDKIILFVHPRDCYLGTGTLEDRLIAGFPLRGKNHLGELLMIVRNSAYAWT